MKLRNTNWPLTDYMSFIKNETVGKIFLGEGSNKTNIINENA